MSDQDVTAPTPAALVAAESRGARLATLFAAWHLYCGHGEDTYAEELLMQFDGDIARWQRLARREDYHFRRGFWAGLRRREERRS